MKTLLMLNDPPYGAAFFTFGQLLICRIDRETALTHVNRTKDRPPASQTSRLKPSPAGAKSGSSQ
jgi:hypothetical protein